MFLLLLVPVSLRRNPPADHTRFDLQQHVGCFSIKELMLTILGAPPPPRLGEMPPGISRFGLEPVPVPLLPGADHAP